MISQVNKPMQESQKLNENSYITAVSHHKQLKNTNLEVILYEAYIYALATAKILYICSKQVPVQNMLNHMRYIRMYI